MTPEKMEELLLKISQAVAQINTNLDADFRAIHGNGKPGLVWQIGDHDVRIAKLEERNKHNGTLWLVIGFIANAIISILSLFK